VAKLRSSPREAEQEVLGRFQRSERTWRALRAPAWLYDVEQASNVYTMMCLPAYALHIADAPFPMPARHRARRLWGVAHPAFLGRCDALTREEKRWIQRWPGCLSTGRVWRPDYTIDDLLDGRVPANVRSD